MRNVGMPELIVRRKNAAPPPMACMYCGAPATATIEWREENRAPERNRNSGGGTDLTPTPTGDDPVSGIIAVLMLPLVLWELFLGLVAGIGAAVGYLTRPRAGSVPEPKPKVPPTTLVVVTVCDRHRRFRDRFVRAGAAGALLLTGLWAWAVLETRRVMGTEEVGLAVTLVIGAVFGTVLLPLALAAWYAFGGPVIADRVTEDAVVLDRVRQAYFDATGQEPAGAD
jgi:hypothetical protein